MPDYRQADLDEARTLVPDAHPKAQERVARALAKRERKGADTLQSKVSYFIAHSAELSEKSESALLHRLAHGDLNFRVIVSWFSQCARAWRAEWLGEPAPEEEPPPGAIIDHVLGEESNHA